jgi:hypothetical protein
MYNTSASFSLAFLCVSPCDLSEWNCVVTPAYFSTDGKSLYHNISCSNPNTFLVTGMTVSCPMQREGVDDNIFFMAQGNTHVQFEGACQTHQVREGASEYRPWQGNGPASTKL